ncbi:MAG: DNA recombination protein RmuC [Gallionella sp.]|jgi:DNA recombination protein RmuC|nr:DNA recombination protein RmuC [Gallionella sp.]
MTILLIGLGLITLLLFLILWKLFSLPAGQSENPQLEQLRLELSRLDGATRSQLQSTERQLAELRQSMTQGLQQVSETLDKKLLQVINESRTDREVLNKSQLESGAQLKSDVNALLTTMSKALTEQLNATGNQLRGTLHERLTEIQADTARKLEEMRKTVDEKLHATLEQRLGEKFNLVSNQLEQVHRGLGEMQNLASGVGDLKRVLTNVKTRGTWGEVQLGALIEQMLTPEQYERNVRTVPNSRDLVEFAIKLPGKEQTVWLPVDAKFPKEDYERLMDAHDRADIEQVEIAAKALELRIKQEAKSIREKYIEPPYTTDFGIMFLPTEGLYAEVLRRPGLADAIQREYRVIVSGPTSFSALLNSLQMGFRTLVIEKRTSEVWNLLGTVKTEFGKFGDVIEATQKKLDAASKQFESVGQRTRAINRKLKDVEALPVPGTAGLDVFDGDDE